MTPRLLLTACLVLTACAGTPPPPDWKMNAVSLLEHHQTRWLEGDTRAAELALANTRAEIAKSARLDLLARAELAACAAHTASLDFTSCPAWAPLAQDADKAERAYAQFLDGNWQNLDPGLLAPHHGALVKARDDAAANRAALAIEAPLPRLIGIALLFKQGRANPDAIHAAVDTASAQGWRRPLLVWLEVQLRRAQAANDTEAMARLQRRIDLMQK